MEDPLVPIPHPFTIEEATSWLRSVDGELYRTPPGRHAQCAWIAVVRMPRFGTVPGRLVIALGDTALEAATAAASQWHAIWSRAPRDA